MKVLVVDDDRDVQLLCRLKLASAGHDVLEATDGRRDIRGRRKDGMELPAVTGRWVLPFEPFRRRNASVDHAPGTNEGTVASG